MASNFFSIQELAQETGISKDTLRIWERRYGFPLPQRGQHNERAYPAEQLEQLRLIKQLMDSGIRPGKLATLNLMQLQELAQEQQTAPPDDLAPLLELVARGQQRELRLQLESLLLQQGVKTFLIETVAPLNHAVGEAWFAGRIGVLDEHLFAEQLSGLLQGTLSGMRPDSETSRALLTTLPGEQHGIGLLMAACMLARGGVEPVLPGVQLPLEEIVRGATTQRCSIVGISCSSYMNRRTIATQLVRLRKLLPVSIELWVGGSGTNGLTALPRSIRIFSNLEQIGAALQQPDRFLGD